MESVIKWQTGKPKEDGYYILSVSTIKTIQKTKKKHGKVYVRYIDIPHTTIMVDEYHSKYGWLNVTDVIAWCPLSEIEPYKE